MTSKEILDRVDKMIAGKIIVDGKLYYASSDVIAVTDALSELARENMEAFRRLLNLNYSTPERSATDN